MAGLAPIIPKFEEIVMEVFNELKPDLSKHDECGKFTEAVAIRLHKKDPEFGHLKKRPGQNQYNGHAVDAILYKKAGRTVDIIGASASPKAKPRWGENVNDKYTDKDWYAPVESGNPNPNPPSPNPPNSSEEVERLKRENAALRNEIAGLKAGGNRVPVSYHDFVTKEAVEVAQAYENRHGHSAGVTDLAHNSYRRLVEGWNHIDVIKGILN